MTGKNILAIVLAIVVGYFAIKIIFGLIGIVFTLVWWLIGIAAVAGVAYLLYRGIRSVLGSGGFKRLT